MMMPTTMAVIDATVRMLVLPLLAAVRPTPRAHRTEHGMHPPARPDGPRPPPRVTVTVTVAARPARSTRAGCCRQIPTGGVDSLGPWPAACTSQPSKGSPASPRWRSGSSSSCPSGSSGLRSSAPSYASEGAVDYVLDLLVSHDAVALSYDECAGVTYSELHRDPDAALARIVERYHQVAEKADAVVVVGSDYTDVGAPTEFSFNARVAANLGIPVMLVLNAHGKTPEAAAGHGRAGGGGAEGQPRLAVRGRGQPCGPGRARRGARRARPLRRTGVRAARGAPAERTLGRRHDGWPARARWSAARSGCWRRRPPASSSLR